MDALPLALQSLLLLLGLLSLVGHAIDPPAAPPPPPPAIVCLQADPTITIAEVPCTPRVLESRVKPGATPLLAAPSSRQ